MGLRSILAIALKEKALIIVFAGTIIGGGATVAMASTPAKQLLANHQAATVAKTMTPTDHAENQNRGMANKGRGTATPEATQQDKDQKNNHSQQCAGLPEIQHLTTQFALSTAVTSDDVKALCSLHDGTFKGTTTDGITVSTRTVYGYGEIDQLLTAAQLLASHDTHNVGGKLTSDNARSYLADVLSHCGATQLEVCLNANAAATHPAHNSNPGNSNNPGVNRGKPTGTPVAKQ